MDIKKALHFDASGLFGLSDNQIIILLVILVFGFFLRTGMIDMVDETSPLRNDAMEYYSYAANMKESGIYSMAVPPAISGINDPLLPDSSRPPGYPLILYPLVELPPTVDMVDNIRLFQVILSTLTIFLAFMLVRMAFSAEVSLVITFLVALSPHLIAMNIYILTETLFTFFLVLFMLIMARAISSKHVLLFALGGITLGVLVLVKSSISLFIYLFLLLYLIKHRQIQDLKSLGVFIIAYYLVLTPWFVHNLTVDPDANEKSKSLVSLQNGSYPGLMYNDQPETRSVPHRADPDYDKITTYPEFIADLGEKVRNDPGKYLYWYAVEKFLMMYSWDTVAGAGDVYVYPVGYSPYFDRQPFMATHWAMKLLHNPLMFLSFIAMFLILWRNRKIRITDKANACLVMLGAMSVYYVGLHILVTPLPRYMIPLRPVSYALAFYLLVMAWEFVRTKLGILKNDAEV